MNGQISLAALEDLVRLLPDINPSQVNSDFLPVVEARKKAASAVMGYCLAVLALPERFKDEWSETELRKVKKMADALSTAIGAVKLP